MALVMTGEKWASNYSVSKNRTATINMIDITNLQHLLIILVERDELISLSIDTLKMVKTSLEPAAPFP